MRHISNIIRAVTDQSCADLQAAHRHAADFHNAMAEAIEAQAELDNPDAEQPFWRDMYVKSVGEAALALQKMPVKWAAVLGAETNAVKQGDQK